MRKFLCPKCEKNLDEHATFCGSVYQPPESHPVMEFIESIHPAVRILAIALTGLGICYFIGWVLMI